MGFDQFHLLGSGLKPTTEIFSDYYRAIDQKDMLGASKILEALEDDHYLNKHDWESIRVFFEKHHLDGRLEIITRRLIKKDPNASPKPYLKLAALLMKSGRTEEVFPLINDRRNLFRTISSDRWDCLNILFKLKYFNECLEEIKLSLENEPESFRYRIMEIRVLWHLGERKLATKNLSVLTKFVGKNSADHLWYSSVAQEIKQPDLARETLMRLIELIKNGEGIVTKAVEHALEHANFKLEFISLLKHADPKNYSKIPDMLYVFETCLDRGIYQTAYKFGSAILSIDPNNDINSRVEGIANRPNLF